jgi:glycerol-3-phosphate O-acyltransferase
MRGIGAVIPVTPVALVASAVRDHGDEWLEMATLERLFTELIEKLEQAGAHIYVPRSDAKYGLETGLRMLVLRHIVEQDGEGRVRANPGEQTLLAYYANGIAHLTKRRNRSRPK